MASIVNTLSEYARLKRLQYSGLETTGTITPSTPEEYITIGIQPYNDNLYAIANLTGTTGFLKKTAQGIWVLDTNTYLTGITSQQIITALGYTPVTNARTLTINGVTYDLTADRSWTIAAGVTSFNTRTGAITLSSNDVTTALGFTPENATNKGVANGYASLDGSGLVPSTQLPSYVDDVLEYTNLAAFPVTGTTGKIYVDLATNKIYRWSGSTYIEVSPTVGVIWGSITGTLANQTDLQSALSSKQPLDADLTAIASLSGTTGFLVKTAADTWTLDTNVYLTSSALTSYVPYTGATTALNLGNNNLRANRIYGSTAITIDNASSAGLVNFYSYTFGGNTYAGQGYVAIGSSLDNGLSIYYTNASVTRIAHLNGASLTGNRTYTLPDATGTFALTSDLSSYVPITRSITINGTTYDLSANRSWTINSMVYPGAGIAVSTGTAWGTSITDNSTNWNTAYSWGNHASAGYLTTSSASATYLTISNAASTYLTASGAASTYQPLDGDLTSIAGLAGTSGLLKKTAANTWTLDTNTYLTSFTETDPTVGAHIKAITSTQISNWDTSYTDRLKWDGGSTGLVAATGRTSLGATTVGGNLFTLTNPTAITFLRINADNTVSTLDAATFRTAIGAGTSSTTGTVTSVAMTTPTGLTVSGSPITSTGTLALTFTAGYSIPTTASQTNWDTAYGWGNHASAGYLTSATAATTYVPVTRTLTINGTAYDLSANRSWTISTGSSALSGLSDVTITSAANGQLLQYSTASSKWVNWTPNYLTSYTETDTLATVTGRGNSTSSTIIVNQVDGAYTFRTSAAWGGWGRNIFTIADGNAALLGALGGYGGSGTTMSYMYFGTAYNATWLQISSSAVNSQVALQQSGNQVLHAGNYSSYLTQLISPNGATVVAADSAMPSAGQSFIHTLGLGPSGNDGHILGMTWANTTTSYGAQIWLDTDPNNRMAFRSRSSAGVWTGWNEVIHSSNYSSYALPLSGGTLSGSITISYSGAVASYIRTTTNTSSANFGLGNDISANIGGIAVFGSAYAASAQYRTDGTYVYSNRAGGLTLHAEGAYSMYLATNGTTAITISSGQVVTFASSITAGGIISAPAASGFANSTYTSGRNPIWRFGNADAYGLSYFQGTGGYTSGVDMIGLHFGTASVAGSQFSFVQDGRFIATGAITATSFNGAGTGLTGTASSLSIGGSAGSVAWTNVSGRPTALSSFTNDGVFITASYLDDYTRGNYRVYSDYGGSTTWYIRSNGQFIWANGHDWTTSFRLSLSNNGTDNGSWAIFGQQESNVANGRYRGLSIRKYAGSANVLGDLEVGNSYITTAYVTGSTNNARIVSGSDWGFRAQNDSGYIQFGPANTSYAHIYTDRGSFYLNKEIEVNGSRVLNAGNYTSYAVPTSISTTGGWSNLTFAASTAWGDGSTTYGVLGAGATGVMINNPHVVWNSGNTAAAIRMGRSGGVSTGAWYQVGTYTSDEFMIAKNADWGNGGLKITSGGLLYYGNTGYKFVYENSGSWGISITGSSASCTGNAATASNSTQWGGYSLPTRTNWQSRSAGDIVVGQLSWKNYGNSHTIFDASAGTSPDGGAVNNADAANAWTGSYPTLMGWNGSSTYGVRVDRARLADSASSVAWTNVSGRPTAVSSFTNDSGYVTGGSSPTFAETYTNGWFRNNTSNTGLYNQSTTQHLSSSSNGYWDMSSTTAAASGVIGIRFYTGGHVNTLRGYVYSDGSGIGFLNNQGGWSVLCYQGASYGGELRGSWTVTGTLTESSSVRYKENIADLSYSLEDALKLRPVEYTKIGTSHKEVGFIAEEVNDIIPEAVMKNEDGSVESISYGRLTAVLLKAVKEQQQQINELKELLNTK